MGESKSTKAFLMSLGVVAKRGEIMECDAWLFMTCSGKIAQVARPSLAAEAMSLSYGADCLQWARVYWYEVLHGEFVSQFILPTDQFPPQTPFRREETAMREKCPGVVF